MSEPTETPVEETAVEETIAEVVAEEAAPEAFVLPADVASFDDDRLIDLHTEIAGQIAAGRTEIKERSDAGTARIADVESLRTLATAQEEIAQILSGRVEERRLIAEGLAELETPAELPEAVAVRAAAAAKVVRVISEAAPSVAQNAAEQSSSERTASAGEPVSPWRSTRDNGSSADWAEIVNDGRLPSGGTVDPRRPVILASARVVDNEDLLLTDSASKNERLIQEAIAGHREARTIEGSPKMAAICDPASIIRDAFVAGTTATPFQSSLVQMTASSGNALKFEYRLPTSIDEAAGGVATWDVADQADVDPTDESTWKPTVNIACASYDTESASEQTASYTVDAFTELSSPESVADFVQAKDRAFARHTEGWMLRKADSFLHHLTYAADPGAGAVPEVIEMVLTALANGTFGERLDMAAGYSLYGSPGLLYALTVDENRKAFRTGSANIPEVQSQIEGATGTSYVQLLDVPHTDGNGTWGASPFAALPGVGGGGEAMSRLDTRSYVLRVLDPSAFVAFSTGEATFGEQVTLDQARRNQRGFFQRMFGGLMKPGVAPGFKITITGLLTDGSRGGLLTPDAEGGS
jgi:hypothetical protein